MISADKLRYYDLTQVQGNKQRLAKPFDSIELKSKFKLEHEQASGNNTCEIKMIRTHQKRENRRKMHTRKRGVSLHGCKASTQRRQPPSCMRSKALLMSSSVMVWVMYSSTLISCSICGVEMPIDVMFNYSFYITVEGRYLVHVLVDEPRNLGATLEATECSPLPNASGHKLERPGAYLLTRSCHAYDN